MGRKALLDLGIILFVIAITQCVGYLAYRKIESTAIEAGQQRIQARAEGAVVWLRRSLEGINIALDLLQKYQLLTEAHDPRADVIRDELQDMARNKRFDMSVALNMSQEGIATFSTLRPMDPINHPQHIAPRHAGPDPDRTYVTDPFTGIATNARVVAFIRHLHHLDGSDSGLASITIDYVTLSNRMREMLTSSDEGIGVWRDGGQLILATRWPTGTSIENFTSPSAELVSAIAGHQTAFVRKRSILNGLDTLMHITRVPEYDLVVDVAINVDQLPGWVPHHHLILAATDGAAGLLTLAGLLIRRLFQARRRALLTLEQVRREAEQAELLQFEINSSIDALPGAIYRAKLKFNGEATFSFISSGFERLTGWSPEQLLGTSAGLYGLYTTPKSAADVIAHARHILDDAVVVRDRQIRLADGQSHWIRVSEQMINSDAEGVEVVGLMTDVEIERKAVLSAQASARLAALGEMATGLAHEISQPIAVITLSAENALRALERKEYDLAADRLRRIPTVAARAGVIMDHVRMFARRQEAMREPVSVHDAIQGALMLTEAALESADITIAVALPDDLPQVLAEQVLLEQVLVNLFLNARDAMKDTMPDRKTLRVWAEKIGHQVAIYVADAGTGLSKEAQVRLFEPFFTTKRPGEGTGLGLSICAGIVIGFGGTITAANQATGAVFTITLDAKA